MNIVRSTLGVRIYLLVAVMVTVVMALATAYFLVTQNQALKAALSHQGRTLAESLAEGVKLGLVLEDKLYIRQAAAGMMGLPNLRYIDLYLPDGRLLDQLGDWKDQVGLTPGQMQEATRSGFYAGAESEAAGNRDRCRDFIVPAFASVGNEELVGFVRIGLSTRSITDQWQQALTTTIWATVLLLLLAIAVVYLPIKRLIAPLRELSDGALEIAHGNLDFRLSVDREDEIGKLADNFNTMAESLHSQSDEIVRKNFELARSERKYRELFANMAQPLYINALDGRMIDCNRAMVDAFGYDDREELLAAMTSAEALYAYPEERIAVLDELLAKGDIKEREVEFRRKDGSLLTALVTARARKNDQNEVIGFEGMIQDVSEMRRLEEQLFQAQKMESIGTLAGGIAHDFNNLLAAIMSSAEMARRNLDNPERAERFISSINQASKRAAELTKNLLGFARKGKTRVEEVDIGSLLEEINVLLRETIDRSIHIRSDVAGGLWPVRGNPSQIHQIVVNLCINAREAILEHGGRELSITVRNATLDQAFVAGHPDALAGNYVRIDVRDDGGGIADEVRDRIFDPFFTTKAVGKGTGLGLATVYGIIKSHEGYLDLETEHGKGTTFHVYLPAVAMESRELPVAPAPVISDMRPAPLTGGTILFVDDEELLRLVAHEYLDSFGYTVLLAENGREAVRLLEEHEGNVDLVVADLVMPEMGGDELLALVRNRYPGMPVIIASGYSETVLQKKMPDQRYDGYLEKPCELELFGAQVRLLLEAEAGQQQEPV